MGAILTKALAKLRQLLRFLLIALIRGYQLILSPYMGGSCRFEPSCSQYARKSLEIHGIIRGLTLSVARLLRCHPWSQGGVDKVPGPNKTDKRER